MNISRLRAVARSLRPVDGAGSWDRDCDARCGGHTCALRRSHTQHQSVVGFSWGAR